MITVTSQYFYPYFETQGPVRYQNHFLPQGRTYFQIAAALVLISAACI